MHEALCRLSGTTLDSVHAEDGPPITQRTSGLHCSAMTTKRVKPCDLGSANDRNRRVSPIARVAATVRFLITGGRSGVVAAGLATSETSRTARSGTAFLIC